MKNRQEQQRDKNRKTSLKISELGKDRKAVNGWDVRRVWNYGWNKLKNQVWGLMNEI